MHARASGKRLLLSKIGDVKLLTHRPLEGTPKTATIRRTATGKWFVAISCEWEPTPLPPTGKAVGIDVGLKTFATLTTGPPIENPRFFRQEEKVLARAQRKHQLALDTHKATREVVIERVKATQPDLDKAEIWHVVSQNAEERAAWKHRKRRRKGVARCYERARWKREDFAHQQSRRIVNEFDVIAVEDLTITNMVQNGHLAKSIHDVAWGQFRELMACKAGWADRRYIAVNPAYTSADCSACGHRKTDLTLAERSYHCVSCGLVIDRDLNAAITFWPWGNTAWRMPRCPGVYAGGVVTRSSIRRCGV